jgi:YHS domain-containing protein
MIRSLALAVLLACTAVGAMAADPAPATKPYPLDTCIVSGEKLGEMGEAVTVVKDGQEVKFCCKSCVKKFNANPDKYLKKIDAASVGKADEHKHEH